MASNATNDSLSRPYVAPRKSSTRIDTLIAGRYRILKKLGEGGMGQVFLVRDLQNKNRGPLALKILNNVDPLWLELFRQEFSILASSAHPNIVRVYDYGVERDKKLPFYTAEYLEGSSLKEEKKEWSEDELIDLAFQMGRALKYLHSRGVLHGDIKPANILKNRAGKYTLVDFGVAGKREEFPSNFVSGTPTFMSPEKLKGAPQDERSDLFSLGVTLYRLASGKRPYRYSSTSLRSEEIANIVPLNKLRSDISSETSGLVAKLLTYNPNGRFRNAQQFLQRLHRELDPDEPIETVETLRAYTTAPEMVGRSATFEQAWEKLTQSDREPPILQIEGTLGIGKSRFLEELRRRSQTTGFRTTFLSCGSDCRSIVDLLRAMALPYISTDASTKKGEKTRKLEAWLLGQIDPDLEDSDSQMIGSLVENLTLWLASRVDQFRHTLFLDDLDDLTITDQELILSVIRRLATVSQSQIRFVISAESWGACSNRFPAGQRIKLEKVPPKEVDAYFRTFLPDIHTFVVTVLVDACEGVPLLFESAGRMLLNDPEVWTDPEAAERIPKLDLFRDARSAYLHRLGEAGDNEVEILRYLAVAQVPLPLSLLEQDKDLSRIEDLPGIIGHLRRSNLLFFSHTSSGPYISVANSAIRSAMLDDIAHDQKQNLHRRIGFLLMNCQGQAGSNRAVHDEVICRHLLQANEWMSAKPFLNRALATLHEMHANLQALPLIELAEPFWENESPNEKEQETEMLAVDVYSRLGRYDQGLRLLQRLELTFGRRTAIYQRRLADLQLKQRNLGAAIETTEKALMNLKSLPPKEQKAEMIRLLSIQQLAFQHQGDMKATLRLGDKIENESTEETVRERMISLNIRGFSALQSKDYKTAKMFFDTILQAGKEAKHLPRISMAWGTLALFYRTVKEKENTLHAFEKAIDAAEKSSNHLLLATHFANAGRFFREEGRYGRAIQAFNRSVELYEAIGNQGELAVALFRRAKLLHHVFGWPQAAHDLRRALALAERAGNREASVACHLCLAWVLDRDWETALRAVDELLVRHPHPMRQMEARIVRFVRDPSTAAFPLDAKGLDLQLKLRVLEAMAERGIPPEEVLKHLDHRLEKAVTGHANIEWLARFLSLKARLLTSQGEKEQAKRLAEQALKLFEQQCFELDERYQDNYMDVRHVSTLKELSLIRSVPIVAKIEGDHEGNLPELCPASKVSNVTKVIPNDTTKSSILLESTTAKVARRLSNEMISRLLEAIKIIDSETEVEKVAERFVDQAIDLCGGERGFLVEKIGNSFEVLTARNMNHLWIRSEDAQMSRSVLEKVIESKESLRRNLEFEKTDQKLPQSIVASGARAILSVPVRSRSGMQGALYIDRRVSNEPFSYLDELAAEGLAEHAGIILERSKIAAEKLSQAEQIKYLNRQLERRVEETESELSVTKELLLLARKDEELIERYPNIIGSSRTMREVLEIVDRARESDTPVCIEGETGTGKELIARALHDGSARKSEPFVSVNCSSIPKDLFESYFFGHKKGAFTGASSDRVGFFVMANNGTLFLDEISEMPMEMQSKLLRVLEEFKVRPVGSNKEISVDVRIISASNLKLDKQISQKKFRHDLYYRLHVLGINLPPLRERIEDIPLLLDHFVQQAAENHHIPAPLVGDDTLEVLLKYSWPGNVRQLRNEVDRIVALLPFSGKKLTKISKKMISDGIVEATLESPPQGNPNLDEAVDQLRRNMILAAMEKCQGNQVQAAKILGVNRCTLGRLIKRLDIKA